MPIGIELKDYIKVTLTTDSEVIELQGEGGESAPEANVFTDINMWTSPDQSYWYDENFSEWGPETPNNGGGSVPVVNVFAGVNIWTSPSQFYWYNVNFSEWGPETPNNGG
jgi:hypothetical protein